MSHTILFSFLSLALSLVLGYTTSLFTQNGDILALAYSLGVFLTVIIFKGLKTIKLGLGSFKPKAFLLLFVVSLIAFLPTFVFSKHTFILKPLSFLLIFTAVLLEESGFRGYLFKKFYKLGWLKLNLITSSLWLIWHLPGFVFGYYPNNITFLLPFILNFYLLGFIYNLFRQKTGGILSSTILHAMQNYMGITLIVVSPTIYSSSEFCQTIASLGIILLLKAWKKP